MVKVVVVFVVEWMKIREKIIKIKNNLAIIIIIMLMKVATIW